MAGQHARLSPSSAHRWLNCPGCIALCHDVESKPSTYAQEGTVAHDLAARCLRNGFDAKKYQAHWGWCNVAGASGVQSDRPNAGGAYVTEIDQEMIDAVQSYLDHVRALGGDAMHVETRFRVAEHLWGTVDCCIRDDLEGVLHVLDYKHGQGVIVEAEENPQLMIYALGAISATQVEGLYDQVRIHIVQPRAAQSDGAPKTWDIGTDELLRWRDEVLMPGAERALAEGAARQAGPWCRFCDGLHLCPEIEAEALASAQQTFAEVPADPAAEISLPAPTELPPGKLGRVLDFLALLEPWAKAVREHAYDRAHKGEQIPGHKLVRTQNRRSWSDKRKAEGALVGPLRSKAYKTDVVTPAQAEKALKAAGWSKDQIQEFLGDLVSTKQHTAVVPESDKRPALSTGADKFKTADLDAEDWLN